MAGQKQGSARVTLREIDLSQVGSTEILPQGVPAAIVGTSKKGPAFVPKTFANMQQFSEVFGSMTSRGRLNNTNLMGPLALNEWMRNSQAGTFLRVLGVGDGDASATNSGFVVGSEQVQSSNGKVAKNPFATIDEDRKTKASENARTHILGCFMTDVLGSTLLKDSGLQTASGSGATLAEVITVVGNSVGDSFTIFLPKEVIPSGTSDITLTIKTVDAVSAGNVEKNVIEIKHDATANNVASRIANVLIKNSTSHSQAEYKFSDLSGINPSQVFSTVLSNNKVNISLVSTAVEGDFVKFTQTAGNTSLLGAASKTLKGANPSAPVIRGILMAPQGVKPSLEVVKLEDAHYVMTDEPGLILKNEVNERVFGVTVNTHLAGYSIGEVDSANQSFKVILNGYDPSKESTIQSSNKNVYTCSFDPQADNYFAKVLNTDPSKIEELGHYLYAHWDIEKTVAIPSNSGLLRTNAAIAGTSYSNMIGFLAAQPSSAATNYENFKSRFKTAKTPWMVSQFYSSSNKSTRPSLSADKTYDLFKLHILDDGEVGNDLYRLLVSDLRHENNDFGSFTLTLERFSSDSVTGTPVISWKQLNLDPSHRNYIGRVIGDKYTYYDFDASSNRQRLRTKGTYEVKNKYVRVELSDTLKRGDQPIDALPAGFKGHGYLDTTTLGFTEPAASAEAQLVYSGANNAKIDKLATAKVLPLQYVDSISRKIVGTTLEASSELAWGVKFGIKKNVDLTDPKELSENEFNKSIASWAKFFPTAIFKEGDNADSFQKSFFSLEKILIPTSGIDATDTVSITSWDNAVYKRDTSFDPSVGNERFVTISSDAKGGNVKYLKFRCMFQGGFDGVNIFDKEKSELSGIASSREGRDETGASKITGPTVMSYRKAVDVLTDKSAAEFQLIAIPGQRTSSVTDYAITSCETRFDAMLILDIDEYDESNSVIESADGLPHVSNTRKKFEDRLLDTSFAAAYFPNILIRRTSDGAPLEVPPSVAMIGVMSRSDALEAPWFAPAGLSRGTLINSIDSKVQMNRDLLDDLYDADINPIYVPAGRPGEVYAFGQKTLLQSQSALDRINVRRLLIDLRRKVRKVGEKLLFEPNRASTLERFSSLVEPIMQDVQRRRGVVRYKVQIDTSTTTQNDIENNTIRGKIFLQPTKSVEFISLDFVVANTID